ncbi:hypothetical protein [Nonomuraea basaltis]|uniref:hypothetical protein n=1 Tax=Nonomuraea basaltis TaxID=2495887 RepID=UPI00110C554C|nr:hypothetical protein [Nonomuraea basaltis]TMR98711.1 hypothetical protein EJK15_11280 [Nonomuraea basaltis]
MKLIDTLLIAAALVLLATQVLGPAEEPPAAPVSLVTRWTGAFLIDYWVVVVCVTLVAAPDGEGQAVAPPSITWS